MKFLVFYKWCTFGGVERVLINRAIAFKEFGIDVKMDLYFFYPGVVESFKAFLKEFELEDYLRVVDRYDVSEYDRCISIDTEEVFQIEDIDRVILEYHTPYKDHGKYIYSAPSDKIEWVVVPSEYFRDVIEKKRPDFKGRVSVLRNFVVDYGIEKGDFYLPFWSMTPLLWLGRIDELKNPYFTVKGLVEYRKRFGDKAFFCCIGSSLEVEKFEKFVDKSGTRGRVVWYPPIRFDKVIPLLKLMRERKAVFVSSSRAESFGMSVAEALFYGLPVLISDIPTHKELVESQEEFLFKLGNLSEFSAKLNHIVENYDRFSREASSKGAKYTPELFIQDWKDFVNKVFKT